MCIGIACSVGIVVVVVVIGCGVIGLDAIVRLLEAIGWVLLAIGKVDWLVRGGIGG